MKIQNYFLPLRKMKSLSTYPKNSLSQFLLVLSLFFTVFAFSGYAGNSKSQEQQTTKTELVLSDNYKTGKRIISYKKCNALAPEYNSFNKSNECEKPALSIYSKLTKVNKAIWLCASNYFSIRGCRDWRWRSCSAYQ
jgi:hypothetical protein